MFGYRVKFEEDKMIEYGQTSGIPPADAAQTHKPIHFY